MRESANAAVFRAPGQPLELRQFDVVPPRGADILVRVTCCTICGSDLHTYLGRRSSPTPIVLGHEIIGRIDRFGPNAAQTDVNGMSLTEGDRITWSLMASCRRCFFCTNDLPQKCEHLFKYGHERWDSQDSPSGGLAEYCLLKPGTTILRLPDCLSDSVACSANCATATVSAALRTAGGCEGKSVLIQGAGMLGLTACAMSETLRANWVLCTDVEPTRLERARSFGATHALRAGSDEEKRAIGETTNNRGVDLAIDFSGSAAAIDFGLENVRIGGTYVFVGSVAPTRCISLQPEQIVRRHLRIFGVHNYKPCDLTTAVGFLKNQQQAFPFADLVGASFALEHAEEAIKKAADGSVIRVAVCPFTKSHSM